ncbi:polysaccharide deacetylase family protein [Bradyrhizobium manausense]|uniref:Chitooligosaccharide deacetylase n=1 Tax=Bradyrhizobium manausense TaxID=989370 RepID=A0A0R3DS89_9BRAD|nr:hypothetical protein AOQ71_15785 [Bradyrhizobium manausense]
MPRAKRELKIAISLVYYVLRSILRCLLNLAGRSSAQRLTILYYHGVLSGERTAFARQMETLHRAARVIPTSYRGKLPPGKKCVAITFDDAFTSVAENALPELVKHSFPATIFVPVAWLGRPPGWAMEEDALARPSAAGPKVSELVMSSDDLKALPASLVSLGSHSMTHPPISALDPERARTEIADSRQQLAELSGREILEFSFPYGDYNASALATCRAAGYQVAYSIKPQEVDPAGSEFLRGRTKVDLSDSPIEFYLKFNGAYEWSSYASLLMNAFRWAFRRPVSKIEVQAR